jgi:opacity protein-like surface antigen
MIKSRFLISGLCVAVASLTLAATAQAQGSSSASGSNNSLYSSGNRYIGLNAGQTDFRLGNGNGFYGAENRNTAYSIYGGSYFRDSNLGMELGYTDFGRVNRAGGSTKADGINLSLIGRVPLGSSFNLLGKVGGLYARTDVSTGAGSGVTPGSTTDLDWTYGVGVEFAFARQWSAVLQYDENNMKFAGGARDKVTNLAVGIRYLY